MKYPIDARRSTPYYEKYFVTCEDTPHAYVSAFREAQFEAMHKHRVGVTLFWVVVMACATSWLAGWLHFVVAVTLVTASWLLVGWQRRREARLLARTFELALRGKEREFHEYMWRHLDRRMLRQEF
ncbi:hypothetical protein F3N42_06950 [Marinihelvus fidelis]|uniref:Uncharacterized protein n=1 Tax=Marinihelvus fidelis TaxID=2613842 RepID=A0A5N0TCW6_9GAMM|nr:hypothetical protein [Marinihelvus fidelis]KAA9131907.1 hypothetical protein F3N42_06950 [Marinihelvus fidelis]